MGQYFTAKSHLIKQAQI